MLFLLKPKYYSKNSHFGKHIDITFGRKHCKVTYNYYTALLLIFFCKFNVLYALPVDPPEVTSCYSVLSVFLSRSY